MSSLEKCLFRFSVLFVFCFWLDGWFFCYWVVWAVFISLKLRPYQLHCLQIYSPIPKVVFSFGLWFPFLCKSLYVCLGPICLLLLISTLGHLSCSRSSFINQMDYCIKYLQRPTSQNSSFVIIGETTHHYPSEVHSWCCICYRFS